MNLALEPELKSNQSITWTLNGSALSNQANATSSLSEDLPRGSYTIVATVEDQSGESKSTEPVTFYVMRTNLLSPQHKAARLTPRPVASVGEAARLAAELQLQALHIEGTELLDALVTSVFLLDRDLQVTYLNAAAQTLLGLGPNQALGRRITELTRGAETLLPLFERARHGGRGRGAARTGVAGARRRRPNPRLRRHRNQHRHGGAAGCCWKSRTSPSTGA